MQHVPQRLSRRLHRRSDRRTLLREEVAKARAEEMAWYVEACEEATDETCLPRTGRNAISCRWKDINKDDNEHVKVRSLLIAREIRQKGTDSYFAGTSPLALVRHVISRAASKPKTERQRQHMVLVARRAFLHADALTETYVRPPHLRDTEEMHALFPLPSAVAWQHHVQKVGAYIGLLSSSNFPFALVRATRDLDMVVHGDNIIAGCGEDLGWLSQKLSEKLGLVQKARLGPRYDGEATVLNRCVPYSDSELTWAADPRHAQLAVAELGLQAARPQTSPGDAKPNAPLDHEELEPDGQIAYRSVSARLAHLSSDRPDIAFACKACSRAVGKATRADLTRLKRIGRDLLHTPRAVWDFPLQDEESTVTIDGFFDADAAGCPKTRRSTSGGSLHIGRHTMAASSTQKVVSLSSAESKDYSMVRCASEAIGLVNTLRELGHEAHVRIWTGAAAARWAGFPQRERPHQTHGDKVLLAAAEGEEPGAQDRQHPWRDQSR